MELLFLDGRIKSEPRYVKLHHWYQLFRLNYTCSKHFAEDLWLAKWVTNKPQLRGASFTLNSFIVCGCSKQMTRKTFSLNVIRGRLLSGRGGNQEKNIWEPFSRKEIWEALFRKKILRPFSREKIERPCWGEKIRGDLLRKKKKGIRQIKKKPFWKFPPSPDH